MKKISVIVLVINILILNALSFYWFFVKGNSKIGNMGITPTSDIPIDIQPTVADVCGKECKKFIDERISELLTATPVPTLKTSELKAQTPAKAKIKNVSYLPISGSGSTLSTNWTSLSGTDFYLSKADYPGLTGIYFEVNMKLLNGNGVAYVRLYDVTHGIGVTGSEVQTSSQTSTFVSSGAISFWDGYNHYQVQARSLTADTTVFESGRLKIITEN